MRWSLAALVLLAGGLGPALLVASRGNAVTRLLGLDLAGVVTCLIFLLLARGLNRPSYTDLALVLAPLSVTGVLVFSRLLGRRR